MSPFREIEHTADWALEVWAPALPELFVEAARGMQALAGARPGAGDERQLRLELTAVDAEALLVAWLQELLFYTEVEGLVFDRFDIALLSSTKLEGEVAGRPGGRLDKVIKAVTYHNLAIRSTPDGYSVTLVFDV
jgi:SHS2 domain-containing protein